MLSNHKQHFIAIAILVVCTVLSSCKNLLDRIDYHSSKCAVVAEYTEAVISFSSELPENITGFKVGVAIHTDDPIMHFDDGETINAFLSGLPGNHSYTITLRGLKAGTDYQIRALVYTNVNLAYWGEVSSFSTKAGGEAIADEISTSADGAIDLGLSVLWGATNIGASKSNEVGSFYDWGQLETFDKTYHSYVSSNKVVDSWGRLLPEYDIATVTLGEGWRMPTRQEIEELLTLRHEDIGDGWVIYGNNGNSIFLPHGGHWENYYWHEHTYYWSSTMIEEGWAYTLNMWYELGYDCLGQGRLVRPVYGPLPDGNNDGGLDPEYPGTNNPSTNDPAANQPTEPGTAVDLGLSVLWAACNIGADSPSAFGNYYGWGELDTFDKTHDNYNSGDGKVGSDGNLLPQYDIATVSWGNGWRMPTDNEILELITLDCQTIGNCWKVTGHNGNSIYLPLGGHYENYWWNSDTYYWSSTRIESGSAYTLNMCYALGYDVTDQGRLVRPVKDK